MPHGGCARSSIGRKALFLLRIAGLPGGAGNAGADLAVALAVAGMLRPAVWPATALTDLYPALRL
ncbi:MAG: hypothetical protein HGA47_07115 [Zoogloea sp.]|nr:hypothetical protein [Zoogloea sp.]